MELLKASTPLVIGILAAYIAYQQWLTARHKLKMELFDRRFKVYQAARDLMDEMTIDASPDIELIKRLDRLVPEAEFLFDLQDALFLKQVVDVAYKLRSNTRDLDQAIRIGSQAPMLSNEDQQLLEAVQRLGAMLPIMFRRYLDLHRV